MPRFLTISLLASAWIMTLASADVRADLIVAGDTTFYGQATQNVTFYGDTVFNPGPQFTLTGLTGDGYFTIDRQAESANNSIAFTGVQAFYSGSYAGLGSYTFGTGPPVDLGGFSGTISNVTQNPNDPGYATGDPSSFASGNYLANVSSFYILLGNGTILQSGSCTLTATLDGLPVRTPTQLIQSPADDNPLYLGDPSNGILVGYTTGALFNLTPSSVPEPSSLVLLGTAAAGMGLYLRIRQRARAGK